MSENTAIEWTDASWAPWEGCTKISPGCTNCYAESMNRWLRKGENWGPGAPRRIYSEDHWEKPIKWQRDALKFDTLHGRHRRVFPSVCDPFDNEAPDFLRRRFWGVIGLTPAIDWLLLTKRVGNVRSMVPPEWLAGEWPANVWLGATIVTQEEADRDIPKLLAVPARVRFLSCEPLLGPIDLLKTHDVLCRCDGCLSMVRQYPDHPGLQRIGWVIAGGESGPKARPAHPDWLRRLRDDCAAAGVPFMFKQWGEWAPPAKLEDLRFLGDRMRAGKAVHVYGNGRDPDGRFRKGDDHLLRVGKKAAGRLLDGVEHNGFPT